jgi:hypothetical protein
MRAAGRSDPGGCCGPAVSFTEAGCRPRIIGGK